MDTPTSSITIDGVTYPIKFNNRSARVAEDIYEDVYGRGDKGYYDILEDAARHKQRALMALYYGALIAGGNDMTWEEFDAGFNLLSIPGVADKLMSLVSASLPPVDGTEGQNPNGESQPG